MSDKPIRISQAASDEAMRRMEAIRNLRRDSEGDPEREALIATFDEATWLLYEASTRVEPASKLLRTVLDAGLLSGTPGQVWWDACGLADTAEPMVEGPYFEELLNLVIQEIMSEPAPAPDLA